MFAGNPLELVVERDELDAGEAAALSRVLEGAGPARFSDLPARGGGADEFQYDLTIRRGDDVVSLRFDESRLPAELAPLVDSLEQRAMNET